MNGVARIATSAVAIFLTAASAMLLAFDPGWPAGFFPWSVVLNGFVLLGALTAIPLIRNHNRLAIQVAMGLTFVASAVYFLIYVRLFPHASAHTPGGPTAMATAVYCILAVAGGVAWLGLPYTLSSAAMDHNELDELLESAGWLYDNGCLWKGENYSAFVRDGEARSNFVRVLVMYRPERKAYQAKAVQYGRAGPKQELMEMFLVSQADTMVFIRQLKEQLLSLDLA